MLATSQSKALRKSGSYVTPKVLIYLGIRVFGPQTLTSAPIFADRIYLTNTSNVVYHLQ